MITNEDHDVLTRRDSGALSDRQPAASTDTSYPHICAGVGCAVCHWVARREAQKINLRDYEIEGVDRKGVDASLDEAARRKGLTLPSRVHHNER